MKNGEIENKSGKQYMCCCGKRYDISEYNDIKFCDFLSVEMIEKNTYEHHIDCKFKILNYKEHGMKSEYINYRVSLRYPAIHNALTVAIKLDDVGTKYVILHVLISQKNPEDEYSIEWVTLGNQGKINNL